MIVSIVLFLVLVGIIVVAVHFYTKKFPPQFYKTVPSQIKSQYKEWTLDGETQNEKEMCLEWDSDTLGMYYRDCDPTKDEQKFSMFYLDEAKTKPHSFGVMEKGRYYCFGPSQNSVTIEKNLCDRENLYQKFSYSDPSQRLNYLGPSVKSTSSQVIIPQSFQTNNKMIVWDTFNSDPKGNQIFTQK
jgi:hypothetical protein